jgi:hypothetical protein
VLDDQGHHQLQGQSELVVLDVLAHLVGFVGADLRCQDLVQLRERA